MKNFLEKKRSFRLFCLTIRTQSGKIISIHNTVPAIGDLKEDEHEQRELQISGTSRRQRILSGKHDRRI